MLTINIAALFKNKFVTLTPKILLFATSIYHFTIKNFKYILKITIFVPTIYVEDSVNSEEKLVSLCKSDRQLITVYHLG